MSDSQCAASAFAKDYF